MANKQRLIDASKIKPMDFPSYEMDGLDVVRYLGTLPTVDAVEVVHGRWIKDRQSIFEHRYNCSTCGYYLIAEPCNYCPDCGAKMDGGNEDG